MGYLLTTQKQWQTLATSGATAQVAEPAVTARTNADWWSTWADDAIKLSPLTNGVIFKLSGTAADETCTTQIWGIAEKGDMELLCSLAWIVGSQAATSGQLFADQCTATSMATTATALTSAADEFVCTVQLDGKGYEQIAARFTVKSTSTAKTIFARTY